MKALILGASGQVGRALAETRPIDVDAVFLDRAGCDISDEAAVARAIALSAPEVVINAAGYTSVDRAESEPETARRLNGEMPGVIAGAAHSAGARMIHISTDFVFDGTASNPYHPDAATGPINVYGDSKLHGERLVSQADPAALIVRTAWVYAPTGVNFVNTMLRLMRERERISVVADQIGTPTLARSLASALWKLAALDARGLVHYTDAGVASWYDFAVAIEEEARGLGLTSRPVRIVPVATEDYPTPARRPAYSVLDKRSTWTLTGVAPHWRVNLRADLKELQTHG